jgi:REP element-mobilizing transposase RayT
LHGDASGSVDRRHNRIGEPLLDSNRARLAAERHSMHQAPYSMDHTRRVTVLAAFRAACSHYTWHLRAAHVRTTHVHLVIEAEALPERIMNSLKSYASRQLHQLGLDELDRKRWARHGSTRWLWKDADVHSAIRYVVEEQGEPMAVFLAEP